MNNNHRFCPPFNMSPQQFQDYKDWKWQRVILYIISMIGASLFKESLILWIIFTILLLNSIWNCNKMEEQWNKDGNLRDEDLR